MKNVEVCAGIGAATMGFAACGVDTVCYNEQNAVFSQWLHNRGKKVIQGDISDAKVVSQMAGSSAGILSGGVSCQPWSSLGDQKGFGDERSRSLPGALRAMFLLQTPLAVLECTQAIMNSDEAQTMLKNFSHQTGMIIHQKLLNLHTFWPARRVRWWATFSHPALNLQMIPDIPPLVFQPSMVHLMPKFMNISERDLEALRLDDVEMERFLTTKKGMFEHQVDNFKALPTATHSWGSQLRGCECGCRTKGFSEWRIENKGLYAQLVPLNETYTIGHNEFPRMRHLHASEVALCNGLHPRFEGFQDMPPRLALAAVGQLASPFQSAWVLSNALWDMKRSGFPISLIESPIHIMKKLAVDLLHARDELLSPVKRTELMARFETAIQLWGRKDADEIMKGFTWAPEHEFSLRHDDHSVLHHVATPAQEPGTAPFPMQVPEPRCRLPQASGRADFQQRGENAPTSVVQAEPVPALEATVSLRSHLPGNADPVVVQKAKEQQVVGSSSSGVQALEFQHPASEHPFECHLLNGMQPPDQVGIRSRAKKLSEIQPEKDVQDASVHESSRMPVLAVSVAEASDPLHKSFQPHRDHDQQPWSFCPTGNTDPTKCNQASDVGSEDRLGAKTAEQSPNCAKHTHAPPTLFHAKPLPRLGCGGPSQCDVKSGISSAPEQPVGPKPIHCSQVEDMTDQSHERTMQQHVNKIGDTHEPSNSFALELQKISSKIRELQTSPLPRLGCGGENETPVLGKPTANDPQAFFQLKTVDETKHSGKPNDAKPKPSCSSNVRRLKPQTDCHSDLHAEASKVDHGQTDVKMNTAECAEQYTPFEKTQPTK